MDGNRAARAAARAADSHRVAGGGVRRDRAAIDGNRAARAAAFAAADSRAGVAVRLDYAAVDGNHAARAAFAAAADCRALVGCCRDLAAVDGNHAARAAVFAAADCRAAGVASHLDRAAVDGNRAARAAGAAAGIVAAAADWRAAVGGGFRRDRAAVDGNRAARAAALTAAVAVAAADSRAAVETAVRLNIAAVDGNHAARDASAAAADSRVRFAVQRVAPRGQFAHAVAIGLGVNRQFVVARDGNAIGCVQFRAVAQNQLYVARDRDRVINIHGAVDDMPARPPRRAVGRDDGVTAYALLREVHGFCRRVPLRVQIRHRVRRACAERRKEYEKRQKRARKNPLFHGNASLRV